MNVTIKNSKSVELYNGVAWSCKLLIDGMYAAFVSNRGDGGETRFDWTNTEFQKRFEDYVKTTPHKDGEMLVSHLCDELDNEKRLKRLCKGKTVVVMRGNKEGTYSTFKIPFSQEVKNKLIQIHGDKIIEFVNERFISPMISW